ncbi:MAG TPA: hypothetical protein VFZ09_35895 [Archangium sp.]|uniref:hypothetical protein n=1 Tax=Archangium sp. TaxID=1872627 RepID=UPI002E3267BB|nr:hypothetical protein [Archangium sp.]HEX5751660.1 hypothetical protein [Archangium sp.]
MTCPTSGKRARREGSPPGRTFSVLALLGGAAGLLVANWGLDVLVALGPRDIPRLEQRA